MPAPRSSTAKTSTAQHLRASAEIAQPRHFLKLKYYYRSAEVMLQQVRQTGHRQDWLWPLARS